MRFRVLGSLRVEAGSTVVPVTSQRQRAVLAVLLLHANRTVSAAGLVGQVWGESGPATAHSLVQTYIWRLRRLLAAHEAPGGQPRITWQPDGYLLRVAEGELDAHVFEQLITAGLSARIEADLALGQHAEAAALLRALIVSNPLDEQLHAHLMTALSQSGRRAEALQVYAEARRLLAGELGLEPGPRLREMQAAILRGDSSPRAAASAA